MGAGAWSPAEHQLLVFLLLWPHSSNVDYAPSLRICLHSLGVGVPAAAWTAMEQLWSIFKSQSEACLEGELHGPRPPSPYVSPYHRHRILGRGDRGPTPLPSCQDAQTSSPQVSSIQHRNTSIELWGDFWLVPPSTSPARQHLARWGADSVMGGRMPPGRPVVSEMRRQCHVLSLYGSAFRDIPHLDEQDPVAANHVPRLSPDSILSALCQLTAIRLGAQRAMISLIDGQRQYILAEASFGLSLRPDRLPPENGALWLGNVSIPRRWGLCEHVLDLDNDDTVLVISDLTQSDNIAVQNNIQSAPRMRFYASAALLSPSGAAVGTVSIFDDKPRDGLSQPDHDLLKDFADTIIEYLNTYTLKEKYRCGERFTRGLVSFCEGTSTLVPFINEGQPDAVGPLEVPSDLSTIDSDVSTGLEAATGTEATTDPEAAPHSQPITSSGHFKDAPNSPHPPAAIAVKATRAQSARHRSIRTLQESILPSNSRSMFSRAAHVMMASSALDGVLILDASVAANGQRHPSPGPDSSSENKCESHHSRSTSSDEESTGGDNMRGGVSSSSSKVCQVLGVATRDGSSEYESLLEPDLARLLHEYSHGKVFTFTEGGLSMSSTDELVSPVGDLAVLDKIVSKAASPSPPRRRNISNRALRSSNAVKAMFPGARSVAFVPFWDYERSRWFAGCLCWSDNPDRLLSHSVDLAYFKVFSHSIMRELSRLDALALNQVRTSTAINECGRLCILLISLWPSKDWKIARNTSGAGGQHVAISFVLKSDFISLTVAFAINSRKQLLWPLSPTSFVPRSMVYWVHWNSSRTHLSILSKSVC